MKQIQSIILGASLFACVVPSAFAAWGSGTGNGPINSPPSFPAASPMTCGDLIGNVGACWLDSSGAFPVTGTGTSSESTTGTVGVQWLVGYSDPNTGTQSPRPNPQVNSAEHIYTGSGACTMAIQITTSNSVGGASGQQHVPPSPYRWTWGGSVSQNDPHFAFHDPINDVWGSTQNIPPAWRNQGNVNGSGVASKPPTGSPALTTDVAGSWGATGTTPTPPSAFTEIAIWFSTTSSATNSDCQNTIVTAENFLKMAFTFSTTVQ